MGNLSLGFPMSGTSTLRDMRERTPFGQRIHAARTHAKLTQTQLAKAAGISQGNLGELEWIGEGSSASVRIAMACGVRPEWLAEGSGPMVDKFTWPFSRVSRETILALDETQLGMVEGAMLNVLGQLQGVVESPNAEDVRRFAAAHARPVKPKQKKRSA